MPAFLLATLAILAPAESSSAGPKSVTDWNQYVFAALKNHAQLRTTQRAAAAARLVEVAQRVAAEKQLPDVSRRRLLGQIQRRLEVSGQRILAQRIAPPNGNADPVGSRKGAEDLKALIEQTIEPLSWDVNGGKGHIHVFHE
jgi:hypothetical protein